MLHPDSFKRRRLPHLDGLGMLSFLTYRQWGNLPKGIMNHLDERIQAQLDILADPLLPAYSRHKEKHKLIWYKFLKLEHDLHHPSNKLNRLANREVAEMVLDCIRYRDGKDYHLICCCIMPNHVHQIIFIPEGGKPLSQILKELKSYSARNANRILERSGPFWMPESFDRKIRDGKLESCIQYTMNNPVNAGLVSDWRAWPYSYLDDDYVEVMDPAA